MTSIQTEYILQVHHSAFPPNWPSIRTYAVHLSTMSVRRVSRYAQPLCRHFTITIRPSRESISNRHVCGVPRPIGTPRRTLNPGPLLWIWPSCCVWPCSCSRSGFNDMVTREYYRHMMRSRWVRYVNRVLQLVHLSIVLVLLANSRKLAIYLPHHFTRPHTQHSWKLLSN